MLFHKRRTVDPIHILLNNEAIDIVPQFNYLGIILDEHLTWTPVWPWSLGNYLQLMEYNRLKYIYPSQVLLTIYMSLFVPHISSGSLVWDQNYDSISKLQKGVIRTITHSNYRVCQKKKDILNIHIKSEGINIFLPKFCWTESTIFVVKCQKFTYIVQLLMT